MKEVVRTLKMRDSEPRLREYISATFKSVVVDMHAGSVPPVLSNVSWTLSDGKAHTLASFDLNTKNQITDFVLYARLNKGFDLLAQTNHQKVFGSLGFRALDTLFKPIKFSLANDFRY